MKINQTLCLIISLALIASCTKKNEVRLASDIKIILPTTQIFKKDFNETHIISIEDENKNKKHQLIAKIEYAQNQLTLVGLTTNYYRLFYIQQSNEAISFKKHKSFPIALKPKLILALFYLIHVADDKRELFFNKKVKITKINLPNGTKTIYSSKRNKILIESILTDDKKMLYKFKIEKIPFTFSVNKIEE